MPRITEPNHLAQPAADAIALDRIADLLRHREADARGIGCFLSGRLSFALLSLALRVIPFADLQHESGRRHLEPGRRGHEIRAFA